MINDSKWKIVIQPVQVDSRFHIMWLNIHGEQIGSDTSTHMKVTLAATVALDLRWHCLSL